MEENFYHINDDLLVKYLLNEATAQEQSKVQHWIAADPTHQKYYEQFKFLWEESRHLAAKSTLDENAAWQRFQSRIQSTQKKAVVKRIPSWVSIAALFLLVASAVIFYFVGKPAPVQQLVVRSGTTVHTDTLPDGSVVTLNKNSSLSYPNQFKDSVRRVILNGEAFFDVAANKKQPFIILVNDVQIRVVGTSFNVRSNRKETHVVVETGLVQVSKKNNTVLLKPKEEMVIQKEDSVLQKTIVKDALYNHYRTKEFVCDNTPLWKLAEVLNEAYGVNIIIANKDLRQLPLTTTFSDESLDNILTIIGETFSIKVEKDKDQIVLK